MNNKVRIAFLFALIGLLVAYLLYAKVDNSYISISELMKNTDYSVIKKKVISTGGIGALIGFGVAAFFKKK